MNEQERVQKLEIEEDTSFDMMKEALDKIKWLQRKTDLLQWEKKQSLSQDMSKMEATLCKLMIKYITLELAMNIYRHKDILHIYLRKYYTIL